ncbi:unnamed protein product [Arabidopsis halleri]
MTSKGLMFSISYKESYYNSKHLYVMFLVNEVENRQEQKGRHKERIPIHQRISIHYRQIYVRFDTKNPINSRCCVHRIDTLIIHANAYYVVLIT